MIVRATHKVLESLKIKNSDKDTSTGAVSFMAEWFVNAFSTGRKKHYIFTESKTLYSIILDNHGIRTRKDFEHLATDVVFALFKKHGDKLPISLFENAGSQIFILKTNNRRIVGSQNDLMHMAQAEYEYSDNYDYTKVNDNPLSFLDLATPEEMFMDQLDDLKNKSG